MECKDCYYSHVSENILEDNLVCLYRGFPYDFIYTNGKYTSKYNWCNYKHFKKKEGQNK
jgi:hypothetical protein